MCGGLVGLTFHSDPDLRFHKTFSKHLNLDHIILFHRTTIQACWRNQNAKVSLVLFLTSEGKVYALRISLLKGEMLGNI